MRTKTIENEMKQIFFNFLNFRSSKNSEQSFVFLLPFTSFYSLLLQDYKFLLPFTTNTIIPVSLVPDQRNSPLSPSSGHYALSCHNP